MKTFEHTVTTEKSFDDTVAAIEKKSAEKGFRVLYTHDVAATNRGKACSLASIGSVGRASYWD